MGQAVMVCKFTLWGAEPVQAGNGNGPGVKVRFGAVYQTDEKKRLDPTDEDGQFGKSTPHGYFEATIFNPNLVELLPELKGKKFHITFNLAE